jgi:hypothetical protein
MKTVNDESLAVRGTQAREVETALVTEIAFTWANFQTHAAQLVEVALEAENLRIRLGVLVTKLKDQVGHGNFGRALRVLPFSDDTARRLMAAARAAKYKELTSLDELRSYNALLVQWGVRQPSDDGHGVQTLHATPNYFISSCKSLGAARRSLTDLLEARPLVEWDDSEREQLREQLRPVVEIFEKL